MTLKIAEIDISDVTTSLRISENPRSQSVKTTLNGNTAVDRIGSMKFALDIGIGYISATRWASLVTILSKISFSVSFTYNGSTKAKAFRLDGAVPSPIVRCQGSTYYCANITLKLEEM